MPTTQAFEQMEESSSRFSCCCCRMSLKGSSLKELSKCGIILGVIILVVGAGGNFLIAGLYSSPPTLKLLLTIGTAVVFLVEGIFLITYNILLLKSVKENEAVAVFKKVKLGCLICLYLLLIENVLFSVFYLIGLAYPYEESELGVWITMLVFSFLVLFTTAMNLYAIYMVKPKLLKFFVLILTVFVLILAGINGFSFAMEEPHPFWIIKLILSFFWMGYCAILIALHLDTLTISPPPKNQHQLQNFDV